MKTFLHFLGHLCLVGVLTLLTQVGGLVYLLALLLGRWLKPGWQRRFVFPLLYLMVWALLPLLVAPLGRVPLPYRATKAAPLQAHHWLTVLCNRHYVRPALREVIIEAAVVFEQRYEGVPLTYLDANFPFWDGFPLLPHRSHNDGRKLDLAFVYQHDGQLVAGTLGFLGYGTFARPVAGELDQPEGCERAGYWQYSLLGPLARPFRSQQYTLDEEATSHLVRLMARRKQINKLFLEPHLKSRWQLDKYNKIRFHGCAAVRHDDHLHVQL